MLVVLGIVLSLALLPADQDPRSNLSVLSRYANVYDFGAVGDGEHDDTQAIQLAIDSLSLHGTSSAGRYSKEAADQPAPAILDLTLAGREQLLSTGTFAISRPLLIESDYQNPPVSFCDGIVVWGYGTELLALPNFRAVKRLKKKDTWQWIKALLVFGPKNYAAIGGRLQAHNEIRGLSLNGKNIKGYEDLTGIRCEACFRPRFKECVFTALHKAVDGNAVSNLRLLSCRAHEVNCLCCLKNDSARLGWNAGAGLECQGPYISDFIIEDSLHTWPEILPPRYYQIGMIHCLDLNGGIIKNGTIINGVGKGVYLASRNGPLSSGGRWWKLADLKISNMWHEALHIKRQTKVRISGLQAYGNQAKFDPRYDAGGGAAVFMQDVKQVELSRSTINQCAAQEHLNGYGGHIILLQGQAEITDCLITGIPIAHNSYSALRIAHGKTQQADGCLVLGCRICTLLEPDYTGARYRFGVLAPASSFDNMILNNTIGAGYVIAPIAWR